MREVLFKVKFLLQRNSVAMCARCRPAACSRRCAATARARRRARAARAARTARRWTGARPPWPAARPSRATSPRRARLAMRRDLNVSAAGRRNTRPKINSCQLM